MDDLSEMRQELMERVQNVINQAFAYRNTFRSYEYLWLDDRAEFMQQFLLYGHVLTQEEIEEHAEEGVPKNPPTLDNFKQQVGGRAQEPAHARQLQATGRRACPRTRPRSTTSNSRFRKRFNIMSL